MEHGKVVLRGLVARIGGLAEPLGGLGEILRRADALREKHRQIELRRDVCLIRRLAQPGHGVGGILGGFLAGGEQHPKSELRGGVAAFGLLARGLEQRRSPRRGWFRRGRVGDHGGGGSRIGRERGRGLRGHRVRGRCRRRSRRFRCRLILRTSLSGEQQRHCRQGEPDAVPGYSSVVYSSHCHVRICRARPGVQVLFRATPALLSSAPAGGS